MPVTGTPILQLGPKIRFWEDEREKVKSLSRVRLFATPWIVAYQAPPSMGFSRQEYWSVLPFPSPGDLPNPGIEPWSTHIPGRRVNLWATREAQEDVGQKQPKWDFPSGPVVKTLLPMQGAPVQCLVKELDPHALTKSSRAATRSHMQQQIPGGLDWLCTCK